MVKCLPAVQETQFDPWVGKIPWRRKWQPTPVFLPGKSHGLRSLVGCSPWGCKESDTTERLPFHFLLSCIGEGNGNPLQCSCLENPRDQGAWCAAVGHDWSDLVVAAEGYWWKLRSCMDVRVGLWRKLSTEELMLLNCGVGEDSWQPVHSKGDQLWVLFGRNDAKAETPVLRPPHVKSWLIWKDSDAGRDCGQEEKGTTEDEMAGWHHWLDGRESEWTLAFWWTGWPGVLQFMGSQRVGHDWATELNWAEWVVRDCSKHRDQNRGCRPRRIMHWDSLDIDCVFSMKL